MNTQLMAWIAFAVLGAQLAVALFFGRLFCEEHRVSRPAWMIAALALLGGWIWPTMDWPFLAAGTAAAVGVLHTAWEHVQAARQKAGG